MWRQKRKTWNLTYAVYMSRLTYKICHTCEYHLIVCWGRGKVENYSIGWQNHRAFGRRDREARPVNQPMLPSLVCHTENLAPPGSSLSWGQLSGAGSSDGSVKTCLLVASTILGGLPMWFIQSKTNFMQISTMNMLRNILHCPYVLLRVFLSSKLEIPSSSYELTLNCSYS